MTPIAQIVDAADRLETRRRGASATADDLDDLRAIPWVFAWGQSRVNLPGWYGLGAGLDAVARERGGLATLRAMFREWPFFTALIENAELSLAKADPAIAELYLARGDRDDLSAAIRDEMARTTELVLAGHRAPASSSTAARSCSRRSSCATPTSTRSRSCSCGSSTDVGGRNASCRPR